MTHGQRLLLTSSAGEVDLKQVTSVSLSIPSPKWRNLLIERFGLQDDDQAYKGRLQRADRCLWPVHPRALAGKGRQRRAAQGCRQREQQQLKGWLTERGKQRLDPYGGLLAGPVRGQGLLPHRKA
jgi:hypothetical protein